MNKDNERITYEEFMTMFKFAPRMCYTLYEKAEDEIDKLKKQKADAVEYINNSWYSKNTRDINEIVIGDWRIDLLRMLGEIDVED